MVRFGRVLLRFFNRVPTEDRHELVRGRAVVGCDSRARLAQTMRRTMVKRRLIAPVPKLVAERAIAEGAAPFVDKECKVAAGRRVDYLLQHRQDRKREPVRHTIAALAMREGQLAAASVLLAEPDNV